MSRSLPPTLSSYLTQHGAAYELIDHTPTVSSLETAEAAHIPPARLAKPVLVESAAQRWLVVIPASHRLELGALHERLGVQCGLATEPEVAELFDDCEDGAVPAFGQPYGVAVLVDDALFVDGDVFFAAGDREHLIRMDGAQFGKLMADAGHGSFSTAAPRRGAQPAA